MNTPAATPLIRAAGPADAVVLATLGERTFREAWQAHNTPADMDAYCVANFMVRQLAADLEDPAVRYFLAEVVTMTFRLGNDLQSDFLLRRPLTTPAGAWPQTLPLQDLAPRG